VERRHMVIPGTQYTGHSLEIAILVVLFRINDFMFYKNSSHSNHKKRCFRIGCLNTAIISLSHGDKVRLERSEMGRGTRVQEPFIIIRAAIWCFFTLACSA